LRNAFIATAAVAALAAPATAKDKPVNPIPVVETPVPTSPVAASVTIVAQPAGGVLRAGTEVPLRMLEELTTKGKRLKVGQRFNMEVSEAVIVSDQTVIPVGSKAIGEVTSVRNKGMWGKSGNIEARVLYVRVGDQQVRLSGAFNDQGVTGTVGVVAAVALVPVVGFFTTGTSAVIASGAPVKSFTDEDVPIMFASAPAPMIVPAIASSPAASPVAVIK
jgi:hypothetical protein